MSRDKDIVARLSKEVHAYIRRRTKRTEAGRFESIDATLRRLFGMKSKTGEAQAIRAYWLLTKPKLRVFESEAEAKGQAVVEAAKAGKEVAEAPIAIQEVPK